MERYWSSNNSVEVTVSSRRIRIALPPDRWPGIVAQVVQSIGPDRRVIGKPEPNWPVTRLLTSSGALFLFVSHREMETEQLGAPIISSRTKHLIRFAAYFCRSGRFYVSIFDLFPMREPRRI